MIDSKSSGITKADRVVRDFTSFDSEGYNMLKLVSQLHTSRLSGYGYTIEAEVTGVTRYAVSEVLDVLICPVCRTMHGKVFEVETARTFYDELLFLDEPDLIKEKQPWPSQRKDDVAMMANLSPEDLVAKGWHVPPYHPWCRGLLVPVEDVKGIQIPEEEQALVRILTAPDRLGRKVTKEDFDDLQRLTNLDMNLKQSPEYGIGSPFMLEAWEALWGDLSPEAFYNMINKSFGGELANTGGTLNFVPISKSVDSSRISMRLSGTIDAPGSGVGGQMAQFDRVFSRLETGLLVVDHEYFKVMSDFQRRGLSKAFMANSMRLYEEMGVQYLDLYANIDVGGYAWAKYGFVPHAFSSIQEDLRAQLAWLVEGGEVSATLVPSVGLLIDALSDNGRLAAFRAIANLGGGLGFKLLKDQSWRGRLRLTDAESMAYFWDYVGG